MKNDQLPIIADFDADSLEEIAADFVEQLRRREAPSISDYALRFPQLAAEIRELFPAIAALEGFKNKNLDRSGGAVSLGATLPERIGDFRLIREIGRGGMGVVFEAEQESLRRRVAIKLLPQLSARTPKHVARFRREAETAARLQHENIVPVYGVGESDGFHYFVMQLIDGQPLDQACRRHDLSEGHSNPRVVAELSLQAARALQFAHEQGVLHRDVKPANLLLDRGGRLWITDFGLARALEENESHSEHLAGTLAYMAPELFSGQCDARSDVYSLGVTLYELLSRRPAFDRTTSHAEMIHQITRGEIPALRQFVPTVPIDLETIVRKATATDPLRRYSSAAEFADDLQRFWNDLPIRARRSTPVERAWRWSRRNPALAAVSSLAISLLVAVVVVLSVGYAREATLRGRAEATRAITLQALDQMFEQLAPQRLPNMPEGQLGGDELFIATPTVSDEIARLLDQLLPLYDQLAEQTGRDPKLLREAANASQRVGDIHQRLGRLAQAEAAYQRANARFRDLESFGPLDTATQLNLARSHSSLATIWNRQHQADQATAELLRTVALLKPLAVSSPTPAVRLELARTHYLLGVHQRPIPGHDPRPAPPHSPPHEHPGPFGRRPPPGGREPPMNLSSRDREGVEVREGLRPLPDGRGSVHHRLEPFGPARNGAAVEQLNTAIELLSDLLTNNPREPQFRHLLALCHRELSSVDFGAARRDDFEKSVSILKGLCEEYPQTADYQFDLSDTYGRIPIPVPPNQLEECQLRLKRALNLSATLVDEQPHIADYMALHVHNHHRMAHVLRQSNRLEEATTHYVQAFDFQSRLVRRHPEMLVHRLWKARITCNYAQVLNDPDAARELLENMLTELESLAPPTADQAAVDHVLFDLRQALLRDFLPQQHPK